MQVSQTEFISGTSKCVGDLYLPEGNEIIPVIVMAHGFAGERKARLPAFAERFCDAGYAVFLFDYRGFGDSEGEPRQLVSPWCQLDDWRAAISYVRSLTSVDSKRLMLWGTSFSGGHVVKLASEDFNIHAVISQIPFTSGVNLAMSNSFSEIASMSLAGIKDYARSVVGASPFTYPVVARPGHKAIMNTAESYDGYLQLFPEDTQWVNAVPARITLQIPFYNPNAIAHKIQCPALVLAGSDDSLIPATLIKKMADDIKYAEYVELQSNHFEPYVGECFEKNIALQLDFLKRCCPVN